MYGNTGDVYVQIKGLYIDGLSIDRVGEEFEIGEYYSTPHGLTSLKVGNCLIYVPDEIFDKYFVKREVYKQYHYIGDIVYLNAAICGVQRPLLRF